MNEKYWKWVITLSILFILLIASIVVSLSSGEVRFSLFDLKYILQHKDSLEYIVLTKIRIPRILLGLSIGGALSLSGVILQGIYRNPLVEPYTLGISGGASLGVALAIVFGLNLTVGAFMLPISGFLGAFITIFLVYFLSVRKDNFSINRMLLIGVMISFIASSSMMFLLATTTKENIHNIIFWVMGSLDEPNTMLIHFVLGTSVAGLISSYFFARPLNALRLGGKRAQHIGVNSALTIRILFIISSMLVGICVAVAGVIGFVGLIIPHLLRIIIGTDFRILLLSSFMGGSIFIILCDVLARTLISPNELPIGVITGMLGGVAFIVVLSSSKSKSAF